MPGRCGTGVITLGHSLQVARLLQNPLGAPALAGARGDIVRVSDGQATVYLTPREYDVASEVQLRYLLARDGSCESS